MGVSGSTPDKVYQNTQYLTIVNEKEIERLQIEDHMLRALWQTNFSSPIIEILENGAEVLEVAKGITPILCEAHMNIISHFKTLSDSSFSFVRISRLMIILGSGICDINELVRVLKPNGWLEISDYEPFIHNSGPQTTRILNKFLSNMKARNFDLKIYETLASKMENTGKLIKIQHSNRIISLNRKAGLIATSGAITILQWLVNYSVENLGKSKKNYFETLCAETELHNSYVRNYRFYAQKRQN
ncbi:hypothetical protein G9A89_016953 [Geosiphon pyriformis]|nr:hypothetical protein G9A89_016953 [Geosiphon pyriformis]